MELSSFLPIVAVMLATGLVAGVIAGMLGVGGGIVIVPVLEYLLQYTSIAADWRMNVAVATSLATIIPTSISSSRAHHARAAVDLPLVRSWALPMLIGALAGSLLAARVHSRTLALLFAVIAIIVSIKMLLPLDQFKLCDAAPRGFGGGALAATIGAASAMMGVGGGTLSVPTMGLCGVAIHRAIGTAALFGLVISLPGTVGYLLATPGVTMPWSTIGLVNLAGVALIAPGSMLTAPLGARIAHRLSRRVLTRVFAVFLLLVAARLLLRSLRV